MGASPKQAAFINLLLDQRVVPAPLRDHALNVLADNRCAWRTVSDLIDDLKECKWVPREPAQQVRVLTPGTYEHAGVIFRVQVSRESGRPYAKVWNGKGWDYDSQAYRKHANDAVEVPLDRAIEIGCATGHCVVCATDLKDPLSVKAGIGPVCVKRYGTTREAIIAAREASLVPA